MTKASSLKNVASERAVLAGIVQHGLDCFVDVEILVDEETFTLDHNKILFKCLVDAISKNDAIGYKNYMELKMYSEAADLYRTPIQNFIMQVADILDIRADLNPDSKVLTIQKFNADFLTKKNRTDGVSNESIKELIPIVKALNDKIEAGQSAGYVKVEGQNVEVSSKVPSISTSVPCQLSIALSTLIE